MWQPRILIDQDPAALDALARRHLGCTDDQIGREVLNGLICLCSTVLTLDLGQIAEDGKDTRI